MSKTREIFNPQKKVLHHLGTVLEYLEGKNTDPINLEIDPSNACNHSCHCANSDPSSCRLSQHACHCLLYSLGKTRIIFIW